MFAVTNLFKTSKLNKMYIQFLFFFFKKYNAKIIKPSYSKTIMGFPNKPQQERAVKAMKALRRNYVS